MDDSIPSWVLALDDDLLKNWRLTSFLMANRPDLRRALAQMRSVVSGEVVDPKVLDGTGMPVQKGDGDMGQTTLGVERLVG